jgi:hypothetical protein
VGGGLFQVGGLGNTLRRTSAFGHDGAADDQVNLTLNGERRGSVGAGEIEEGSAQKTGGGRKWSVFGRTGSLRGKQ